MVLITANFDNGCTYCMAAHTTMSKRQKLPEDVIQALRDNTPIADAKLEALRVFTRAVFHKRGWVDQADLDAFYAAGYEKHHVLEVVVGLAFKTISNYTNHVVDTPVDDAFAERLVEARGGRRRGSAGSPSVLLRSGSDIGRDRHVPFGAVSSMDLTFAAIRWPASRLSAL